MYGVTRAVGLAAGSVAGLLLTAACGGGSGATSPAAGAGTAPGATAVTSRGTSGGGTQVDLCTVLTTAQIQSVIGVPVGPGKKAEDVGVGCGWLDPNPGNNSNVGLLYVDPGIYEGTKQASGANGITVTKVEGIGDEAYAESLSPTSKPLLLVKKGGLIVSISADIRANGSGDTDSAKDLAAEKQLAAIVAAAL